MRIFLGLVILSFTLSLGCTSGARGGRRGIDSGVPTPNDGGVRDTGMIVLMDSSVPPRDSSVPPRDSGGTCAEDLVPPFSGTACSSATSSCTAVCTDGACINSCLDADSNPDCGGCANQNIISCFNSNGCQAQWNCFVQCATAFDCSAMADPRACVVANCGPQDDAYNSCTAGITTGGCGTSWMTCIP